VSKNGWTFGLSRFLTLKRMSAQKRVTTQFEYLAGIAYNVLPEQVLEWNSSTAAGGIASALQMAKAVRNRTRFLLGGEGASDFLSFNRTICQDRLGTKHTLKLGLN
jgi:hypothetical protein